MARSVAGLFPDYASAEQTIVELKRAGVDPSRIGVVMRDKDEAIRLAREQDIPSTEGAVAGGLIGGSLGALLAAVGVITIPGIGPLISGGILVSLIGGAAGWLVGGLTTLGIPREEAEYYQQAVQDGRALVTVDTQGRDEEARAIMLRNGAEDLESRDFGAMAAQSGVIPTSADANESPLPRRGSTNGENIGTGQASSSYTAVAGDEDSFVDREQDGSAVDNDGVVPKRAENIREAGARELARGDADREVYVAGRNVQNGSERPITRDLYDRA